MSFSAEIKEMLCKTEHECPGCALSELSGFFEFSGREQKNEIRVLVSTEFVKKRVVKMLSSELDIVPEENGRRLTVSGADKDKLGELIKGDIFLYECCKVAYMRGAFLGGGSVNAPGKKCHMDFSSSDLSSAQRLTEILEEFDFKPKTTVRKDKHVVYIKESAQISDLLGYISNGWAGLEFISAQIENEIKSSTQRRVNCDSANLDKQSKASSRHLMAIKKIKSARKWSAMPDVLREIGDLRLKYPEASLEELGRMTEQGIGKSGVNHRLSRITEYAKSLGKD